MGILDTVKAQAQNALNVAQNALGGNAAGGTAPQPQQAAASAAAQTPAAPPPPPQNMQFSVSVNGATYGPYDMNALAQMASQGQFNAQSQVWRQGMAGWQPAGTVPELAQILTGGGSPPPPPRPATEKVGNIRKCPACGAEVPAMSAVCPSCGHEFSNVQVANSVQTLFEKLEAIDSGAYDTARKKEEKGAGALGGLGAMFTETAKIYTGDPAAERKKALIEGFPIPNAKEDILEFIVLASSKYQGLKKPFGYGGASMAKLPPAILLDGAWKVKLEQAYTKAKLTMASDKDALAQIESILKEKKIIK